MELLINTLERKAATAKDDLQIILILDHFLEYNLLLIELDAHLDDLGKSNLIL